MVKREGFSRQPIEFFAELTDDPAAQDTADRLRIFFEGLLLARFDGDHFELTFTVDEVGNTVPHFLGFLPKDLWITSQTGDAATVTVNYNDFTIEDLNFDIAGLSADESVTIRFFAGSLV